MQMKQEFITASGKVILHKDRIMIRHLKETGSYEYYKYLAWLLFAITVIESNKPSKPLAYVMAGITALILLGYLVNFFYMNKWKNSFACRHIRQYKLEDDLHGLETKLTLNFRSGTAKTILFRTSEQQHQPFVKAIEQYISQLQFA